MCVPAETEIFFSMKSALPLDPEPLPEPAPLPDPELSDPLPEPLPDAVPDPELPLDAEPEELPLPEPPPEAEVPPDALEPVLPELPLPGCEPPLTGVLALGGVDNADCELPVDPQPVNKNENIADTPRTTTGLQRIGPPTTVKLSSFFASIRLDTDQQGCWTG